MKISLALFILGVVGLGWLMGSVSMPDGWYADLVKPFFNPPSWVFGPVWTVLYILMAIAGWRTWYREGWNSRGFKLWVLQLVLNLLWSPVFFVAHSLVGAFVVLAALWLSIIAFMVDRKRVDDRPSAGLFMPYLAWVTFAGVLNLSLILLNR